jgi:hypothetical protein
MNPGNSALIAASIPDKALGRSMYSINLYQMLLDNDQYDPGV